MITTTVEVIEALPWQDVPAKLDALRDGDGVLHVGATLSGKAEMNDYGVPGSPRWMEITDIEIECYEINGHEMTPQQVEKIFGAEARKALDEMADEAGRVSDEWE